MVHEVSRHFRIDKLVLVDCRAKSRIVLAPAPPTRLVCGKHDPKFSLLARFLNKYKSERTDKLKWKQKWHQKNVELARTSERMREVRAGCENKIANYVENIRFKNERLASLKYENEQLTSEYELLMSERDVVLGEIDDLQDKLNAAQDKCKKLEKQVEPLNRCQDDSTSDGRKSNTTMAASETVTGRQTTRDEFDMSGINFNSADELTTTIDTLSSSTSNIMYKSGYEDNQNADDYNYNDHDDDDDGNHEKTGPRNLQDLLDATKYQLDAALDQRNDAIDQIRKLYNQIDSLKSSNHKYKSKLRKIKLNRIMLFTKNIRGGRRFEKVRKQLLSQFEQYRKSDTLLRKKLAKVCNEHDSLKDYCERLRSQRDTALTDLNDAYAEIDEQRRMSVAVLNRGCQSQRHAYRYEPTSYSYPNRRREVYDNNDDEDEDRYTYDKSIEANELGYHV